MSFYYEAKFNSPILSGSTGLPFYDPTPSDAFRLASLHELVVFAFTV